MRALRRPIQYSAKHTLEILEKQLERIDTSSALGMWEFASYVISSSPVVANNVAHMYLALTQGEGSFISSAAVHLWDGKGSSRHHSRKDSENHTSGLWPQG